MSQLEFFKCSELYKKDGKSGLKRQVFLEKKRYDNGDKKLFSLLTVYNFKFPCLLRHGNFDSLIETRKMCH